MPEERAGEPKPTVSVLVPTLNEERHIEGTIERLRAQRFDGELEFLVIDGGSEDSTVALLERIARDEPRLRVLHNPRREVPAALNIGLRSARGEFVARMDAHTVYPPHYIAAGVARLEQGGVDWVSGAQIAEGIDPGSRRVALALSARMGFGGARFRTITDEFDSDAGFTGILRRTTLLERGGWNEAWPVNEDGELAARVLKAGGRIVCIPAMAARYVPRNSLRALAKQYFRYGRYRAKTCGAHPESMRRSHVLPPALCINAGWAIAGRDRPGAGLARGALALYALALVGDALVKARHAPCTRRCAVPVVLAVMHFAWGLGFLVGCARFGPPLRAVLLLAAPRR
jgi:succinoglycan biosynthesis protein ExoA